VREVSEQGRSITITQNGEAKVVVMDIDTYDRFAPRDSMAAPSWIELFSARLERLGTPLRSS